MVVKLLILQKWLLCDLELFLMFINYSIWNSFIEEPQGFRFLSTAHLFFILVSLLLFYIIMIILM